MSNQLVFKNHIIETITHENKIWFTAKTLAKALNYRDPKSISIIYNRSTDEFTEGMSAVINLITSTKAPNLKTRTRIFSLRGAHLIAMFARTPVAEQFRKWVLDLIDKETSPTPHVNQSSTIIAPNREVLPKGIYHAQSKYNPYRAAAWNAELKQMIAVGVFPTVQEAVAAQEKYLKTGQVRRIQKYNRRKLPEALKKETLPSLPSVNAADLLNHTRIFLETAQLLYLYPKGRALFWDLLAFTQEITQQPL